MSYNKPTKYKILDMKNNQQLINDEMVIQKLPFRTEDPRPPKWFKNFAEKQNKVNTIIFDFMEKQDKVNNAIFNFIEKQEIFNKRIEFILNEHTKRFDKLEQRVGNIETEVKSINTRIDNIVKLNNLKE